MNDQVEFYDAFARTHARAILGAPDPSEWTSDMALEGPTWQSMRRRVAMQARLMKEYFHPRGPVVDLGCGFGRQSLVAARGGFPVLGIDSSPEFIALARQLLARENLTGTFQVGSILTEPISPRRPNILLLDVLEHLPPALRPALVARLRSIGTLGARCLVSLPQAGDWSAGLKHALRSLLGRTKNSEHPFVLPSPRVVRRLFRDGFRELFHSKDGENMFFVFEITHEAPPV